MPRLNYSRFWRCLAILQIGIVIVLTLIPNPPAPPGPFASDKVQHFLAYAWLMLWVRQTFEPKRLWAVLLIAMGVLLEFLQGLTGARTPDVLDAAYNTLGVAIGWGLAHTPIGQTIPAIDRRLAHIQRLAR